MVKDISQKVTDSLGLEVTLVATDDKNFGDYSANIAMVNAKKEGVNPRKLAAKYKEKLEKDQELSIYFEKIEVAGPGFINFYLNRDFVAKEVFDGLKQSLAYGNSDSLKGKKIVYEYAHPNTHKAFHIGHLRNITTGEALSRLTQSQGAEVARVNYQGDVGLHIAKALWGILDTGFADPGDIHARAEYLGKTYAHGATKYEEDESVKSEIDKINVKIYDKSDKEINKLYKETRQWSLDYFSSIYDRVYTSFDRLYFESECAESGKEIALKALKDGIFKESEGAVIFPGSEYGLHDRVFVTGKGVPTYEGKDLGLAKLQFAEQNPDLLIHTVGPEQKEYFKVIFKALEMIMPETKGREMHVPYGWVRLKEGKMSSRTGNVVLGEWLLDEAKSSIKKSFDTDDDAAETIAVAAVKYSFLRNSLAQDIAFDIKESISLEGNSGPYLQYTYARCKSVLRKAGYELGTIDTKRINEAEMPIIKSVAGFADTIEASALNYSPNTICNYLFDLAQKYNGFYNTNKIIGSDNEAERLFVTYAVSHVIKNGLKLLGIKTLERM